MEGEVKAVNHGRRLGLDLRKISTQARWTPWYVSDGKGSEKTTTRAGPLSVMILVGTPYTVASVLEATGDGRRCSPEVFLEDKSEIQGTNGRDDISVQLLAR